MGSSQARREQKARERVQRKLDSEIPTIEFAFGPGALQYGGPVILTDLSVTESHATALTDAGEAVPPRVQCRFLLDTGADVCVVKHAIADKARLKLISSNVPIHGVGVDTTGRIYMGRIWFGMPSKVVPGATHQIYVDTQIMSGTLGDAQTIDGIIGRDVLYHFDLRYHGNSGKVTMRYLRP